MPAGLNKITNYYNRLEAWKDWNIALEKAKILGLEKEALLLAPDASWGWRKIDPRTAKLKALIRDAQQRDEAGKGRAAGFLVKLFCTECRQTREAKIYTDVNCPNCGNDEFELTNANTGVA